MTYLAFDFGDGTTCASCFDNTLNEPVVLNIVLGNDEIWTNISFDENSENPIVGLRQPRLGYPSIFSNWKSKPSKLDEGWDARRKNAIDFMRICFKLFLSNNLEYTDGQQNWTGMRNGAPCRVVVGVPCDWSEKDVLEYKEMAKEAGLPDVLVFKESQAATLYARKFLAEGLPDDYLERGVLMIDVGSSTTDFTYIKGLCAAHCGLTLGAKYVEQAFLADAMSKTGYEYFNRKDDEMSKEQGRNLRIENLLDVRGWKEGFFEVAQQANPAVRTSHLPGSNLNVGYETHGQTYIIPKFVDRCLNDDKNGVKFMLPHLSDMWTGMDKKDTWRGHFRRALECVKEKWHLDSSKLTIFVTGGASRMSFVEDDIKDVYGNHVRCFFGNDRERSFSVVKGLAWAAYATDLIAEEREQLSGKISAFLSPEHDGYSMVSKMLDEISSDLAEKLVPIIKSKMKRESSSVNTQRKIEDFANKTVSKLFKDIPKEEKVLSLAKAILETEEMKGLFVELQESLGCADICAKMPMFKIEGKFELPNVIVGLDLGNIGELIGLMIVAYAIGVPAIVIDKITFGVFDLTEKVRKYTEKAYEKMQDPNRVWDEGTIEKAADQIDAEKIKNEINAAFSNSQHGPSFQEQVKEALEKILLSVKQQELKALEGLFDYEEQ